LAEPLGNPVCCAAAITIDYGNYLNEKGRKVGGFGSFRFEALKKNFHNILPCA
jgi:hypothetical protein